MDHDAAFFNFPPDADDLDRPLALVKKSREILNDALAALSKLHQRVNDFPEVGSKRMAQQTLGAYMTAIQDLSTQLDKTADKFDERARRAIMEGFHRPSIEDHSQALIMASADPVVARVVSRFASGRRG
jgi:hypothetical protein